MHKFLLFHIQSNFSFINIAYKIEWVLLNIQNNEIYSNFSPTNCNIEVPTF